MSTNENTAPSAPSIPGTMPYGRPMTPPMGGAYGATSHSAAYNPYGSGRKLIIGEGITMSGEIEHCDHLIVEGTVQATLKEAKLLDISEAGVFYGTVDIEEATIAGRFEGDINVAGRLTVKASGVITGSIRYKELAIEAGATIEGTLSPVGPRKGDTTVAAADFSKGKAVAKQAREAAQKSNDQQLFTGDKSNAVSAAQ
ncbi:MAG: polymer-forming cytoskeletal protein [Proteobacteria bacterium]|nr:polymer-forming cytoskeletal protein [Pseudomonadota bacterium]